jgi:hypothetical protein
VCVPLRGDILRGGLFGSHSLPSILFSLAVLAPERKKKKKGWGETPLEGRGGNTNYRGDRYDVQKKLITPPPPTCKVLSDIYPSEGRQSSGIYKKKFLALKGEEVEPGSGDYRNRERDLDWN